MEVVHRGFDNLDVSYEAQTPKKLADTLEEAKNWCNAHGEQYAIVKFGEKQIKIFAHGISGGYSYVVDTGPMGELWFFKKPNPKDPFGIRVSGKSLPLAINGLAMFRDGLDETLETFGVASKKNSERISRADFAVDILKPEFVLNREHFVMHGRMGHITQFADESSKFVEAGRSNRVTSVTIGKNPNKQVIVYDKRDEVLSKRKVEWPEIWNANLQKLGREPLEMTDASLSRVWRVELRAFKDHLRSPCQITHWDDLYDRIGNVFSNMAVGVRLAVPSQDTNRSRWANSEIWDVLTKEVHDDLLEMKSDVDPERVKLVRYEEHLRCLRTQRVGLAVNLAATIGKDAAEFEAFLLEEAKVEAKVSRGHRVPIEKRIEKAGERYVFCF